MPYDLDRLRYEARQLIEADGSVVISRATARTLSDLMYEKGPMAYLVATIVSMEASLTTQLLSTHMTTDEAIRKAIGTQGQLSGIALVLQSIVEVMTPPVEAEGEQENRDGRY